MERRSEENIIEIPNPENADTQTNENTDPQANQSNDRQTNSNVDPQSTVTRDMRSTETLDTRSLANHDRRSTVTLDPETTENFDHRRRILSDNNGKPLSDIPQYVRSEVMSVASFKKVAQHVVLPFGADDEIDLKKVHLPKHCTCNADICIYDPRKNRTPSKPMPLASGYLNFFKSMFGVGILAMPLAISQAGLVVGPVSVIAIGVTLMYTHRSMLDSLNEVSRLLHVPYMPYPYGFRLALQNGPWPFPLISGFGPMIITFAMLFSQIGICSIYMTFCADLFNDVRELFMMSGMLLTTWELISPPYYDDIRLFARQYTQYFLTIGIVLFSVSAVGVQWQQKSDKILSGHNFEILEVVLSIDKALPNPAPLIHPCGILNVGIVTHCIIGTIFGILGYHKYGEMNEIIIRSMPIDDWITTVVSVLFGSAIFLAYPIQSYPGIEMLLDIYKVLTNVNKTYCTLFTTEILLRTFFVSLTFAIVACVPHQAPMVAFVGYMCTVPLAVVFPAIMDLCLKHPNKYGPRYKHLFKNLLLILLGVLISVAGAIMISYLAVIDTRTTAIALPFVPPKKKPWDNDDQYDDEID